MIILTDWIAAIPPEDKHIAYVGENETVTRQFFLPDLSYRDYAFYLDMAFDLSTVTTKSLPRTIQSTQQSTTETVNEDGTTVTATANTSKESYTDESLSVDCAATTDIAPLAVVVEKDGIFLTWTVFRQQTQLPGPLRATLRAVGPNGEIKKSAMMVFIVAPSVVADPASPIPLTEHEQMERAMVEAFEYAAQDKIDELITEAKEWVDNVNGVYVGSGDMPDGCVVQIDPEGEALLLDNEMSDTSENVPKTKVVKAYVDNARSSIVNERVDVSAFPWQHPIEACTSYLLVIGSLTPGGTSDATVYIIAGAPWSDMFPTVLALKDDYELFTVSTPYTEDGVLTVKIESGTDKPAVVSLTKL